MNRTVDFNSLFSHLDTTVAIYVVAVVVLWGMLCAAVVMLAKDGK